MATQQDVLQYIQKLAQEGFPKDQLLEAFAQGSKEREARHSVQESSDLEDAKPVGTSLLNRPLSVLEIFYSTGFIALLFGLYTLAAVRWETLSPLFSVFITLGVGIIALIGGDVLSRHKKTEISGHILSVFAGIMLPLGLWVLLFQFSGNQVEAGQKVIAGAAFLFYIVYFYLRKQTLAAFFAILYGTWFYFLLTEPLVRGLPRVEPWQTIPLSIQLLIPSVVYLVLGTIFARKNHSALTGFLYGCGSWGTVIAAFALGIPWVTGFGLWALLYPLLLAGLFALSVHEKSKSVTTGTLLGLLLYLTRIIQVVFPAEENWPIAWILAGAIVLLTSYLSRHLPKLPEFTQGTLKRALKQAR